MRLIFRGALLGGCLSLMLAAGALAYPATRTLAQTFPVATRLCARSQAQQLPPRLEPDSADVMTACTTLGSAFTIDQTALTTSVQDAQTNVSTARAQLIPALKLARQAHDRQGALTALVTFRGVVRAAVTQRHAAARLYVTSTQAARAAFWGTIRSLPGGRNLPEDPTSTATPTVPPLTS